jgi:hypothetical protein
MTRLVHGGDRVIKRAVPREEAMWGQPRTELYDTTVPVNGTCGEILFFFHLFLQVT